MGTPYSVWGDHDMRGNKVSTCLSLPRSISYCPPKTHMTTPVIRWDLSVRKVRVEGKLEMLSWLCRGVGVPWQLEQWIWVTRVHVEVCPGKGEECEVLRVLWMEGEVMAF